MKGQIGTYLHELLKDTRDVYGTTRGETTLPYIHCDLTNYDSVSEVIDLVMPEEIYNLAGETNSNNSILFPLETFDINARAVMILCEKIKKTERKIKLFQAGSSELFKGRKEIVVTPENTAFYPKTPYSIAKTSAYWTIRYYREKYNLPFYNGFIFNTESPIRRDEFLTKKISKSFLQGKILELENLSARKNWLHAKDVANAIKLCMTGSPGDYVFSSGKTNTIKELVEISYGILGGKILWEGAKGFDSKTGEIVVISSEVFRSFDLNENVYGIDSKMSELGWEPEFSLEDIMREIMT